MKKESNEQKLLRKLIERKERGVNSIEAMRHAGSRASARKNNLVKKGRIILGFDEKWHGIQSKRWVLAEYL